MKQCPACNSTYTDATLRYCLADGSALTDLDLEEQTVVRQTANVADETVQLNSGGGAVRVSIPPQEPPATKTAPSPESGISTFVKALLVVLVLGILLIAGLGVAGFIYYSSSSVGPVANNNNKMAASPSPTADQTDDLRDQIANLEKRLNEQRVTNRPANIPLTLPNQTATSSARANSPGDGFLALRTMPSSESGERILKIPHGAAVSVGGCLPAVRSGRKTGRWCRASYNGYSGWVFDAYLVY